MIRATAVAVLAIIGALIGAVSARPAHADREKPSSCTSPAAIGAMRETLTRSLDRQNLDLLAVLRTGDGTYDGDFVCTGRVMTNKGAMTIFFFNQQTEGQWFGRVIGLPPERR